MLGVVVALGGVRVGAARGPGEADHGGGGGLGGKGGGGEAAELLGVQLGLERRQEVVDTAKSTLRGASGSVTSLAWSGTRQATRRTARNRCSCAGCK